MAQVWAGAGAMSSSGHPCRRTAGRVSSLAVAERAKTTITTLLSWKAEGRKFPVLTCYDYSTARLMEQAGIDTLLVGDTYAEVCLGHSSTLPATVEHLVTICAGVRRGAPSCFLIGDMPYLSYQINAEEAIRNAGKFMVEGGCDCVKVEVDRRLAGTVEAMSRATIPVMAHLGLRPQSVHHLGGYRMQGRSAEDALRIIEDAASMEQAGAVALLLEAVPADVAKIITQRTKLPVIGISAGGDVDAQVLVMHDMLGFSAGHPPRAVKRYANLHDTLVAAFKAYADDVTSRRFPTESMPVHLDSEQAKKLEQLLRTPHASGG
jgi:3-methyl-2-oxobutanoate hydroxymethyltransferase